MLDWKSETQIDCSQMPTNGNDEMFGRFGPGEAEFAIVENLVEFLRFVDLPLTIALLNKEEKGGEKKVK